MSIFDRMKKKQFWKLVFHKDTIMLIFSLVFLWMGISLAHDQLFSFESMEKHTGVIGRSEFVITKLKDKPFFKDTMWELRLYLVDEPEPYLFPTHKKLPEFDDLFWGDSVSLFTKSRWLGIFGFGERRIRHLERVTDKKIFLDHEKVTRSQRGVFLLPFAFFLGFSFWYVGKTRRRMNRLKYESLSE